MTKQKTTVIIVILILLSVILTACPNGEYPSETKSKNINIINELSKPTTYVDRINGYVCYMYQSDIECYPLGE